MKKVLFYTSGLGVGGVEKVLLQILKKINLEEFQVSLALNNGIEDYFESEIPSRIHFEYMIPKNICLKTRKYKELKKKNFLYGIHYSLMLWYEKILSKKNFNKYCKDFDVVIDFKSGDYLKNTLDKKMKKIVWLHGELKNLKKYRKNNKKFINQLQEVDKIIVISDEMKRMFIETLPQFEKKLVRIYNPFDFEEIRLKAKDLSEERENDLELMMNKKYFCSVARLDLKSKDFKTLFEAFEQFIRRNNDIDLIVVGDGPDRSEVENILNGLSIQNRVHLIGNRKNPYPWIENSEVMIQSSFYEGLPTVLIEGLVLGKKIISSDCPTGPAEILKDGKIGELFAIGDVDMLIKKIEKSLKVEISEKLLKKIEKRIEEFNYLSILKKIEKQIRD